MKKMILILGIVVMLLGSIAYAAPTYVNTNIGVSISPTDNLSGVARWRYRLSSNSGATWGTFSSYRTTSTTEVVTLSTTGDWKVQVEVEDNAGNTSVTDSGIYYIDKDVPINLAGVVTERKGEEISVLITNATDAISGLAAAPYSFRINGGSWSPWSANTAFTYTGLTPSTSHNYEFRVRDTAGNITTLAGSAYTVTSEFEVTYVLNSEETMIDISVDLKNNNPTTETFITRENLTDGGTITVKDWGNDITFNDVISDIHEGYTYRVYIRNPEGIVSDPELIELAQSAAPSVIYKASGNYSFIDVTKTMLLFGDNDLRIEISNPASELTMIYYKDDGAGNYTDEVVNKHETFPIGGVFTLDVPDIQEGNYKLVVKSSDGTELLQEVITVLKSKNILDSIDTTVTYNGDDTIDFSWAPIPAITNVDMLAILDTMQIDGNALAKNTTASSIPQNVTMTVSLGSGDLTEDWNFSMIMLNVTSNKEDTPTIVFTVNSNPYFIDENTVLADWKSIEGFITKIEYNLSETDGTPIRTVEVHDRSDFVDNLITKSGKYNVEAYVYTKTGAKLHYIINDYTVLKPEDSYYVPLKNNTAYEFNNSMLKSSATTVSHDIDNTSGTLRGKYYDDKIFLMSDNNFKVYDTDLNLLFSETGKEYRDVVSYKGILMVATSQGVYKYEATSLTEVNTSSGIAGSRINDLEVIGTDLLILEDKGSTSALYLVPTINLSDLSNTRDIDRDIQYIEYVSGKIYLISDDEIGILE